ncbi:L-lysine 6-transaminase [Micromonospora sp. NPDC050980]|uniref:L-lysine 6-transaminase n=1 Tax=Micromonospora sp. NPDC050980 TaxID=3155161 RepID=UPI00340F4778
MSTALETNNRYDDIAPAEVRDVLGRHMLVDGYDLVLDLAASEGSWIVDALTDRRYLDFQSFFASAPLGVNPPQLRNDRDFMRRLAAVATNKPSNPDIYTVEYATFVAAFTRVLGDPDLPLLHFVEGGALAVENALKVAFDWKARRSGRRGRPRNINLRAMHLERAFHGRGGYTLSLTNTDDSKTALYPKFVWPRIPAPAMRFPAELYVEQNAEAERRALEAARTAFDEADDDIACFIAEPIQGEGGDNHLSPAFLQAMQQLCHEYDALFVLDEVQTGCGTTGTAWCHQQLGLAPDVVAFGKKTQVCGVMAGRRVEEVAENVFRTSSRISSTWGGNLTDMVRATRILEVFESEDVLASVASRGTRLVDGLVTLTAEHPGLLDNARGRGLMCAVDLPDRRTRDAMVSRLYRDERVIVLPGGERAIRFRPALTVSDAEIDLALRALDRSLRTLH